MSGPVRKRMCPRCGACAVNYEPGNAGLGDSLTCRACNYVGPASNPNQDGSYLRARASQGGRET